MLGVFMQILILLCIVLAFPTSAIGETYYETRRDYFYGTGNSFGGSSSTYIDPLTGDVIISVTPRDPNILYDSPSYNSQNPIYIYPQVTPYLGPNPPMGYNPYVGYPPPGVHPPKGHRPPQPGVNPSPGVRPPKGHRPSPPGVNPPVVNPLLPPEVHPPGAYPPPHF